MNNTSLLASGSLALLISTTASADIHSAVEQAVKESKTNLLLRYRYEFVDQDGLDEEAHGSTLLSRLTFTSGAINGFRAVAEIDNVSVIGAENYNNTYNGMVDHPVVADPDGTEINQAYVNYSYDSMNVTGGKQRINLDDQRFIGGVGWRQNEQTYDGYRLQYGITSALNLDYSYLYNVNRIFGEDSPNSDLHGEIHLINSSYSINETQKLSAFVYLLDFDQAHTLSSQTVGLRYQGQFSPFAITASLAQQQDYGDNSNDYDALYGLVEISGKLSALTWGLGYELLGEDNGVAVATPLATGHKFQGFADKFLTTPANGIEDTYVSAAGSIAGINLNATYHNFKSDQGSIDYGNELDMTAGFAVSKNCSLLVKYAHYEADTFATDTDKIWLMVQLML
ncbi:MAG: alginate export family protein [Porticoccaceae bacterium]|nr:alginate export family protein [Porticoccaceae bacterium]